MLKEGRLYALLAYCFIFCIIPLILKKEDEFVQFHGRQGLALFLCEMVVFILSIVFPFLIKPALFIFSLVSFWGMLKALRGEKTQLPLIQTLAQKLDI